MAGESNKFVTFMAMNCALGFFSRYYLSIFNSLKSYLEEYVFTDASKGMISLLAAGPPLGAAIISLFTGSLAKKYGRRKIFMLSDVFSIIGVALTMSSDFIGFLIGRIVTGFALGINFSLASVYIIEIAPAKIRASLGSYPTLFMSIGITLAYALAFCVPNEIAEGTTNNNWRILLAVPAVVFGIRLLLLIFVFKTDTPIASMSIHKKEEDAVACLKKIYKNEADAVAEFNRLQAAKKVTDSKPVVTLKQLFTSKQYRKAFFVGNLIAALQMLCGLTPIVLYSTAVFKEGLVDPHKSDSPKVLTLLFGISMSVGSILSTCTTKKLNRKPVLVWGYVIIGLFAFLFSVISFATDGDRLAAKIMIIIWGFPFGMTVSPATFIYLSELLPEIGYSFSIFTYWVFSYSVSQMFVGVSDAITYKGTFLLFAGFCWIGAILLAWLMVESKGRTKEELLEIYSGMKLTTPKTDEKEAASKVDVVVTAQEPQKIEDLKLPNIVLEAQKQVPIPEPTEEVATNVAATTNNNNVVVSESVTHVSSQSQADIEHCEDVVNKIR